MVSHVLQEITSHIQRETGLSTDSISPKTLGRAIRDRMREGHIDQETDYLRHTEQAPQELQELIERIVVPETWFFRYHESFRALTEWVSQSWRTEHPAGILRILSAPCSTGEEPYSIAMALLDAGLPSSRIHVDALDISLSALETAQRGVYRAHSFRNEDTAFRDRYFHAVPGGFRLADTVRRMVHFRQGNLLHLGSDLFAGSYDVAFCRNGLIYFDAPAQQQIITDLISLITSTGLLFVGPAEATLLQGRALQSLGQSNTFAYRKGKFVERRRTPRTVPPPNTPAKSAAIAPWRSSAESPAEIRLSSGRKIPKSPRRNSATNAASAPSKQPAGSDDRLLRASQLADQGSLDEAITLCESYIANSEPSADAYYLQGVLYDATRNPAATDCYRKALYLQPDHAQALAHLILLLNKQGETEQAQRLAARAQRVEERNGS